MNRPWIFICSMLIGFTLSFAQLTCGFVVDLSPPYIDSLYPADGDTVSITSFEFIAYSNDDGAGIWLNYVNSMAEWDTADCDVPVATYITWAVNDFSVGNFLDTTWGAIRTTDTFNPCDSIRACVHIIDSIHNLGCSCCPNYIDTCWTFYIFACDSFQLSNYCPDPCGIVTSCTSQTVSFLIDTLVTPVVGGPDSSTISVEVYVNGVSTGYGTIGSETWATYLGNPDDAVYPDTIEVGPPSGYWNHGDTVMVVVYQDSCPVVLADTCRFIVDLVPPVLTTYSPENAETLTSAVVNISGNIFDDFIGVFAGSTWVSITTYDTLGGVSYDTTYGLGNSFNINRTFTSGDSIVVCVHSIDDVDVQPGCTCPPNAMDSCWWFTVLISEPYGWVVIPFDSNGNGTIVSDCFAPGDSACGNQIITWRVYDSQGMTTSPVHFYINGVEYDETSPAVTTTLLGTDTLEITFDPSAIGTCWTSEEWVIFELDSAQNILGFNLVSPIIDSFIIDLDPPIFSGMSPADGSILNDTMTNIYVEVTDDICGNAIITNVHAGGILDGSPADFDFHPDSMGTDYFSYHLTGLENGDSLTICAFAEDTCADYCGPNSDSVCWTFTIVIGEVSATVIEPLDTNGDGWVISNCADQQIIWNLDYDDSIGIDWSRLWVTVDGVEYNWGDSHLDTSGVHTLVFTPSPDWTDGDSIVFCLDSLFDTTGAELETPVCGWVLIDLEPPVIVGSTPADGDTIYSYDVSVNATFYDSVCMDTLTTIDSVWATTSVSGLIFEGYDFPLPLTGLEDGDSVDVCAIVSDGCRDYCDVNTDTICWYFRVMMGEPWGEFITPPDTNDDMRRITTCEDGGFIIYVYDSHGMDTTYLHLLVEGTEYHYGDPEISVDYVTDSTTLEVLFEPGFTLSSGTWVNVTLDSAVNMIGDTLVESVIDSFLIDTEPPTFTYTGPTGTIAATEAVIDVDASDDICASAVSYDSLVITSSISGIDWLITTGDWDTTITGLLSGDSVSICAYAHDVCSDTCGPNYGDSCWSFLVETGITITLEEPLDINGDGDTISACATQQILWTINSDIGVDSSTIAVDVCGTGYSWGDAELSASGDTLIWTPSPGFWVDGTYCSFSLIVCDSAAVCDTSYGQVLLDLAPPTFSGEYPSDLSTILVDNTDIYIGASDAVCLAVITDSLTITSSVSGLDITITDTLGGNIFGLVDGDVVTVCAFAHDTCADYFCDTGNYGDTCWTFDVALGAVRASVIAPEDINGDLCIQTACECQPILWQVISQHGVDTTTFEAVIDGITYSWGPEFTLTPTPPPDDTIYTIEFYPAVAGSCWTDNGYIVDYAITYLADTLGTDSLSADVGGSFQMLTEAPVISLSPMPTDTPICVDTLYLTTGVDDTIACTFDGTVAINGTPYPIGDVEIPVLSGDTICVSISAYNEADYGDSCEWTDTLFNWTNSLDTCYAIQCECNIVVYAGPDQYSCPGENVILGCDPVYSGTGFLETGFNWYDDGDTVFSTEENPVVTPNITTTYIVEGWAVCVAGDTVWDYDTVDVFIDYEPVVAPTITSPTDGSELLAGLHTLVWFNPDTMVTEPVYYQVLIDGALASDDSLIDTTFDFNIDCEETLTIAVVAFNSCYYELDDSCNPADTMGGYVSATYETSAVITVWGEPCGQPRAEAIYPPPNTITACQDQSVIFTVWDASGVPLVVESLRVQIGGSIYDTSETFIIYTEIYPDSGMVDVGPPTGNWDDNDTITIRIITLYNEFDQPLPAPASLTFYTDFTPPIADMSYPIDDTTVNERSPEVIIPVSDNVCGVLEDSFIVRIYNNGLTDDTLTYPSGPLDWSSGQLSISFEELDISLADAETIWIDLHTCDCVDSEFCGANCADYSWSFWYPYEVGCDRYPNPFTPNDDTHNDFAQFSFPDMGVKTGIVYIFNVYNSLVKEIEVPAGLGVSDLRETARWDGTDANGNKVPQGLYIYVIEVDGEIVCEGTVTVAR
ncbi:hypothetical protein DRQ33_02735 [bacterium]|nr:MAG: hypothetical protein DRQ33_02735 [bacterium]